MRRIRTGPHLLPRYNKLTSRAITMYCHQEGLIVPELTHGPIVGATTPHSVSIWLRADTACEAEIRLAQDPNDLPGKSIMSGSTSLRETTDFTGVIELSKLEPDSRYAYLVLLDGEVAHIDENLTPGFHTFPASGQGQGQDFSFAFGSCFIPQKYKDCIFKHLSQQCFTRADGRLNLRFFMMLGDNVYVDEFIKEKYGCATDCPIEEEDFREAYRETWKFKNFRRALSQMPTYMIFDDHEFWDNWGNIDTDGDQSAEKIEFIDKYAQQTYRHYQDSHNPDYQRRHAGNQSKYYYSFEYGHVGFFVLDCRTERKANSKIMLGVEQWHALFDWLRQNNDKYAVKFVVSSVPICFTGLPHWLIDKFHEKLGDQWHGYTKERLRLFEFIQKHDIQGVHFLSGDIHLGQAVAIRSKLKNNAPPVYAYTSSPLAQSFWLLSEKVPFWLNKMVYGIARWLVQILHGIGIYFVANDSIMADGIHYEPRNLFSIVEEINHGVVHVRQRGQDTEVRFEIYNAAGACVAQDEPHLVLKKGSAG